MITTRHAGRRTLRYAATGLIVTFFFCGAVFLASTQAHAQTYDQSGPWWGKVPRPILAIAYTPEPSDYNNTADMGTPARTSCEYPNACKYFDTDFTNSDFSLLWGPGPNGNGRNDLATIRKLGMNFITLYDWSGGFCRNHTPFLNAAWNGGKDPLHVAVPISDYFVQNVNNLDVQKGILTILYQAYGLNPDGSGTPKINPAISMWRIGNEAQLHGIPAANVAQVVKMIVNFENSKNLPDSQRLVFTSDVSFGALNGKPPGIYQIEQLKSAFANAGLSKIWNTRFMASVNTFNPATDIKNYVENTFPSQPGLKGLPMFFAEYGRNSKEACEYLRDTGKDPRLDCNKMSDQNRAQAEFEKDQFQVGTALAESPRDSKTGYFYGFSVFQWQDAFWKCPNQYQVGVTGCTESLFGIQTVGPQIATGEIPGGTCGLQHTTYPVNALEPKPIFKEIPGTLRGEHLGEAGLKRSTRR